MYVFFFVTWNLQIVYYLETNDTVGEKTSICLMSQFCLSSFFFLELMNF